MWTVARDPLPEYPGERLWFYQEEELASVQAVLEGLRCDAELRTAFNKAIADAPFPELRWEVPLLSQESLSTPFECVLIPSPGLTRLPEPEAFASHFEAAEARIAAFLNLSGDAVLIVPRAEIYPDAYTHLAVFTRYAPQEQQDLLWQTVGSACLELLPARPIWLSTAGAGVAWLHVRLDTVPKYFSYLPYKLPVR